jgi:hypothetical protein
MLCELRQRVNDILQAVSGDEEAFNRFADVERLGVYLRHGRLYPTAVGRTHTARLAGHLPSGDAFCSALDPKHWLGASAGESAPADFRKDPPCGV